MDPFQFYRNLRRINPSPYMYFLKDGDTCVAGSSPEIHLQIRDRVATLKPIAGTKPRDAGSDVEQVISSLIHDEKERAEHLMLVDLARNDLSRICKVGTVEVKSFMQPEVYSHVVHLVSEVEGVPLRRDRRLRGPEADLSRGHRERGAQGEGHRGHRRDGRPRQGAPTRAASAMSASTAASTWRSRSGRPYLTGTGRGCRQAQASSTTACPKRSTTR